MSKQSNTQVIGGRILPDIRGIDVPKIIGRIELGYYDKSTLYALHWAASNSDHEHAEALATKCINRIHFIKKLQSEIRKEERAKGKAEEEVLDAAEELFEAAHVENPFMQSESEDHNGYI